MVLAVIFPGQGSQRLGMGDDVFGRYPGLTRHAGDVLGYDLAKLCRDDPDGLLSRTDYTQPALYTVNALRFFEREHREGRRADCYLGHSLGEYNALLAAEVFDFETGLRLVKRRGELMAEATSGSMTAVTGLPGPELLTLLERAGVTGIDIAAYNTDAQVVMAGPVDALRAAHDVLGREKVRFAPLRVGGAFHSRYMETARVRFEEYLAGFTFDRPRTQVIANVTGRPYAAGLLRETLGAQLVEPVRWAGSIRHLLGRDGGPLECEEIGGKDLTRMVEHIRGAGAPDPIDARN